MNKKPKIKKKKGNGLDENPLKIYGNLLFISSEKGTKPPLKSDFAIGGDIPQLITAIVIQMNRHPEFAEIMKTAVRVYNNSDIKEFEEAEDE